MSDRLNVRARVAELQQWRSGKRRVFWRIRHAPSGREPYVEDICQAEAKRVARAVRLLRRDNCELLRVTVGPAKKKEAG